MPRTPIAPITPKGPYPTLPIPADSLDIVLTAADVANGNSISFGATDAMLVLARNSGASAYTLTLTSVPDALNRTGDVSAYSLGAGDSIAFLVRKAGWVQSDGALYLSANNAAVLIAGLTLP